jgi:hypothetical protein
VELALVPLTPPLRHKLLSALKNLCSCSLSISCYFATLPPDEQHPPPLNGQLDGRNLSTKETIFLLLMDAQNKFSMKRSKLTRNVMISGSALLFTALQLKAQTEREKS